VRREYKEERRERWGVEEIERRGGAREEAGASRPDLYLALPDAKSGGSFNLRLDAFSTEFRTSRHAKH